MSVLKLGSEGELVKKLQEKLGVEAIGKFGPRTQAAVKAWQAANGLTADGIVGPFTLAKLGIESLPAKTETPAAPAAVVTPVSVPAGSLNLSKLKGHVPDSVLAMIPDTAAKFGINSPLRLAHFLAQCSHESGHFTAKQENLNYSAKGLMGIFKKYFPTLALANAYQRNPQKIASKVYGNRMGNGSESSGEGYKFRGRGFIQLTGKDNYTLFGNAIGQDLISNPDRVATEFPLLSAAWFFKRNGIEKMADAGYSDAVVTKITKRVNGGTIGLSDRIKEFRKFYKLLV